MLSLRLRIPLFVSLFAIAILAAAWWIQQRQLLPSFVELERQYVLADLARGQGALANELHFVGDYVSDWSGWDDTYKYVADRNPEFVASNLATNVFRPSSFDYLCMVGLDGRTVWSGGMLGEQPITVGELPQAQWPLDHPLLAPKNLDAVATGVVVTQHGPLLLASRPMTDSARTAPSRGWILMGRFLTQARIADLRQQTQLDLTIAPVSAHPDARLAALHTSGDYDLQLGNDTVLASVLQKGLRGPEDTLLLQVRVPRSIVAHGEATLAFAFAATGFAVVLLFGLLAVVLQRSVVAPVARLTAHALRIRASGDLAQKSGLVRGDEIGTLAREFDLMTEQLAALQARSVQVARDRGMAEVARSVLHDVGNALQPVQADLAALRTRATTGCADDLQRVHDLLQQHAADLGEYLQHDAHGSQVPAFLGVLAGELRDGSRGQAEEIERLSRSLSHIQALVDQQIRHASLAAPSDVLPLAPLLREAGRMSIDGPADTATVRIDVDDALAVAGEHHKLLAVFVNLLRNARQAVAGLDADRRVITVAAVVAGERVHVEVRDRGRGIAADHLVRIFEGGQSLRPGGHGIGLHGCANRIAELRGRLWATSDGLGTGATFHVELPIGAAALVGGAS